MTATVETTTRYTIEKIRQSVVHDIFRVTDSETGKIAYVTTNRSAEYSAQEILDDIEYFTGGFWTEPIAQ